MTVIFFDLDDTLFDYQSAKNEAVGQFSAFSSRDFSSVEHAIKLWDDVTAEYMHDYHCGRLTYSEQQQKRVVAFLGRDIPVDQAQSWYDRYQSCYEQHWTAYSDVLPVLNELKEVCELGIITDGPPQQRRKLKALDIEHFFAHMTIPNEVGAPKPEPAIFALAAQKANALPEQCWYIGNDWRKDYCGALSAGFQSVWLNRQGKTDMTQKHCANLYDVVALLEQNGLSKQKRSASE